MNYFIDFENTSMVFRSEIQLRKVFVPVLDLRVRDQVTSTKTLLSKNGIERLLSFKRLHPNTKFVATMMCSSRLYEIFLFIDPFLTPILLNFKDYIDTQLAGIFSEVALYETIRPVSNERIRINTVDEEEINVVKDNVLNLSRRLSQDIDVSFILQGDQPRQYKFLNFEKIKYLIKTVVLVDPLSNSKYFREHYSLKNAQMTRFENIDSILIGSPWPSDPSSSPDSIKSGVRGRWPTIQSTGKEWRSATPGIIRKIRSNDSIEIVHT